MHCFHMYCFHFGTSMPFREAGIHFIIRLSCQKTTAKPLVMLRCVPLLRALH